MYSLGSDGIKSTRDEIPSVTDIGQDKRAEEIPKVEQKRPSVTEETDEEEVSQNIIQSAQSFEITIDSIEKNDGFWEVKGVAGNPGVLYGFIQHLRNCKIEVKPGSIHKTGDNNVKFTINCHLARPAEMEETTEAVPVEEKGDVSSKVKCYEISYIFQPNRILGNKFRDPKLDNKLMKGVETGKDILKVVDGKYFLPWGEARILDISNRKPYSSIPDFSLEHLVAVPPGSKFRRGINITIYKMTENPQQHDDGSWTTSWTMETDLGTYTVDERGEIRNVFEPQEYKESGIEFKLGGIYAVEIGEIGNPCYAAIKIKEELKKEVTTSVKPTETKEEAKKPEGHFTAKVTIDKELTDNERATVKVFGPNLEKILETDENGLCVFENIALIPGEYYYIAAKEPGYSTEIVFLPEEIRKGQRVDLHVKLKCNKQVEIEYEKGKTVLDSQIDDRKGFNFEKPTNYKNSYFYLLNQGKFPLTFVSNFDWDKEARIYIIKVDKPSDSINLDNIKPDKSNYAAPVEVGSKYIVVKRDMGKLQQLGEFTVTSVENAPLEKQEPSGSIEESKRPLEKGAENFISIRGKVDVEGTDKETARIQAAEANTRRSKSYSRKSLVC